MRDDLGQIVDIQLKKLAHMLSERGYELEMTGAAREFLVEVGYDPDFGARPLKRAIQREVQDPLALHILSISLVGYPSANVVTELGAQGICISAGSACHRGQLSHVYRAMGLDKKTAAGVLRVSFGPETTKEEIDALVSALKAHRDTRFPML